VSKHVSQQEKEKPTLCGKGGPIDTRREKTTVKWGGAKKSLLRRQNTNSRKRPAKRENYGEVSKKNPNDVTTSEQEEGKAHALTATPFFSKDQRGREGGQVT